MSSSSLKILTIALLIFFVAGLAVSFYPLIHSVTEEVAAADAALSTIRDKVMVIHTSDSGAVDSARDDLRKSILEYEDLKSLAVFGPDDSLLYAYASNPGFIRIMDSEKIEFKDVDFPSRPIFERIVSTGNPGKDDYYTKGIFEVLNYDDVYRVAVVLFIFLLVFTTALFFFLLKGSGKVSMEKSTEPDLKPESAFSDISPSLPIEGGDMLYAPDSLLCHEEFLEERLDNELKRAAAFDQDLLLAMISCRKASVRENYIQLADEVRNHFEFHDLLFEYEKDLIAVVLPNLDLEQGISEFSEFHKNIFSKNSSCNLDVAIGFSSRNGRLIRSERLITEAKAALKKAFKNSDTRIIGFKPDPGKYRDYLAAHPLG